MRAEEVVAEAIRQVKEAARALGYASPEGMTELDWTYVQDFVTKENRLLSYLDDQAEGHDHGLTCQCVALA